jgi:predicted MPP superfamily phosphohydrolase
LAILAPIAASIWYVPFRLSRLMKLGRAWRLYVAVAVTVLLSILGMNAFATTTKPVLSTLATAAGLIFYVHLLLTMSLLVLDASRLVFHIPDKLGVWVAMGVAFLFTIIGAWRASTLKVEMVEIPIVGLQKEVILMHISDVHLGNHRGRSYLEQIVRETNRLKPDLVLINGDLVDGNSALEPDVLSPLGELNAPAYFTTGNHENYIDTERALEIIAGYGVRILHNEVIETHGLQLVGLDYMKADEDAFVLATRAMNRFTIKEELPKIPFLEEKPVILMHHSPVGLDYVTAKGVELMLSGHTHAGQVFPATLIMPLLFPLNKGLYQSDGTYFFVSQGAGTFGPRIRLGTSNEIDLILLRVPK